MEKKFELESRYNGYLSLKESESGIVRTFPNKGFKMSLSKDSILQISYTPGGRKTLKERILFKDKEIIDLLDLGLELEDTFSEKDLKELLLTGTVAQLEDALEFGNKGTIELIKDLAIELKISDNNKRDAISKKTGTNINNIINLFSEEENNKEVNTRKVRSAEKFIPTSNIEKVEEENKTEKLPRFKIVDGERVRID